MDLSHETNWYAIQTKPCHEGFAAANIEALNLRVFLPKLKQERFVQGIARTSVRALFSGYLFARFCPRQSLNPVRYTRGVLRVLGSGGFPIPVNEEVIEAIQARVFGDGYFRLSVRPLAAGHKVRVQTGPFEGFIGAVERESNDGRRVTILLEAIQQARLSIEKRWLQLLPA